MGERCGRCGELGHAECIAEKDQRIAELEAENERLSEEVRRMNQSSTPDYEANLVAQRQRAEQAEAKVADCERNCVAHPDDDGTRRWVAKGLLDEAERELDKAREWIRVCREEAKLYPQQDAGPMIRNIDRACGWESDECGGGSPVRHGASDQTSPVPADLGGESDG